MDMVLVQLEVPDLPLASTPVGKLVSESAISGSNHCMHCLFPGLIRKSIEVLSLSQVPGLWRVCELL